MFVLRKGSLKYLEREGGKEQMTKCGKMFFILPLKLFCNCKIKSFTLRDGGAVFSTMEKDQLLCLESESKAVSVLTSGWGVPQPRLIASRLRKCFQLPTCLLSPKREFGRVRVSLRLETGLQRRTEPAKGSWGRLKSSSKHHR